MQGPGELGAHHLLKDAIEVTRHLLSEKCAISSRKASSGLEKVRHIQRAARSVPVQIPDGVISHGVQDALTCLPFPLETSRGGGPMQHLWLVSNVADQRAELLVWGVLERIVKQPGIYPRATLL